MCTTFWIYRGFDFISLICKDSNRRIRLYNGPRIQGKGRARKDESVKIDFLEININLGSSVLSLLLLSFISFSTMLITARVRDTLVYTVNPQKDRQLLSNVCHYDFLQAARGRGRGRWFEPGNYCVYIPIHNTPLMYHHHYQISIYNGPWRMLKSPAYMMHRVGIRTDAAAHMPVFYF
jgi:hypothetical protein